MSVEKLMLLESLRNSLCHLEKLVKTIVGARFFFSTDCSASKLVNTRVETLLSNQIVLSEEVTERLDVLFAGHLFPISELV